jgi:hypothetical protein
LCLLHECFIVEQFCTFMTMLLISLLYHTVACVELLLQLHLAAQKASV